MENVIQVMAVKSHPTPPPDPEIREIDITGADNPIYDRKKLLELTASLIQETHGRIAGNRFRVQAGDRERLAYIRTLRDLIALHALLLKDAKAPRLDGLEFNHDTEMKALIRSMSY